MSVPSSGTTQPVTTKQQSLHHLFVEMRMISGPYLQRHAFSVGSYYDDRWSLKIEDFVETSNSNQRTISLL